MKNIFVLFTVVLISLLSCTKEKGREVIDEEYGGKDKDDKVTIISGEDKDAINAAYEKIEGIILTVTTKEELASKLSEIKAIDAVEDAWVDGGQLSVKFKKGGVVSWIVIEETTKISSTKTSESLSSLLKAISTSTVDGTGRKVLLVNQEYNDEKKSDYKTHLSTLKTEYEKKKFSVTAVNGNDFHLDFASKELNKYDLMFFVAPGVYSDELHWIYTGKEITDSENLDYILNNKYEDWSRESVAVGSIKETRGGTIAFHKYLMISEKFISDNYTASKFKKSFVYSSAGKMFEGPSDDEKYSVGRAFVNNGAAVFADWSKYHADGVVNGVKIFLKFLEAKTLETIIADMEGEGTDMSYLKYYPGTGKDYRINNAPNAFALTFPKNDADKVSISLTLKWNKAIDINGDDVKYSVKLFEKGDETKVIKQKSGLTDNFFKVGPGLKINKEYSWYVIASDPSGAQRKSATYSFKTINEMPEIKCVAPTIGEIDVNRNIALRWQPDTYLIENEITYQVYLSINADMSGAVMQKVDAKDRKYQDVRKALAANTKYYWQVVAVDKVGNEYPGKVWDFTTGTVMNTPSTPPVLLDPTDGSTDLLFTDINFRWKASEDENGDDLTYTVYYKVEGAADWEKVDKIKTTTLKKELKANTKYLWKVSVFDGYTVVESDDVFSFTTRVNSDPSHPVMISPKRDEANLGKLVKFEWLASVDPDGETPWYHLYITDRYLNPVFDIELHGTASYEMNTLEYNKEYKWYVIAHDNNGGRSGKVYYPVWPFRLKDLADLSTDDLIYVEGGDFDMGDIDGDSDADDVRNVTISDFYIGKYEVTHKEFIEFLKSVPSGSVGDYIKIDNKDCAIATDLSFKGSRYADSENDPVMLVTYEGATKYCEWKSTKDGCTYRLPTEAEWEYAARGGRRNKDREYAGSDNAGEVAWTSENAGDKLHVVGTKNSNELLIHDMSGNVWEWCLDWYGSDYYSSPGSDYDPEGPANGVNRVIRGGSWLDNKEESVVYNRSNNNPRVGGVNLGFRIVRVIP